MNIEFSFTFLGLVSFLFVSFLFPPFAPFSVHLEFHVIIGIIMAKVGGFFWFTFNLGRFFSPCLSSLLLPHSSPPQNLILHPPPRHIANPQHQLHQPAFIPAPPLPHKLTHHLNPIQHRARRPHLPVADPSPIFPLHLWECF